MFAGAAGSAGHRGTGDSGGGVYVAAGSVSLYNVTVAFNSGAGVRGSGVDQRGGSVAINNSLLADNGYSGAGATAGADYLNESSGGEPVALHSLFGSTPTGVSQGAGSFIGDAGLAAGLAPNGGPTDTIALLAGSQATDAGQNPINGVTLFTDERGYVPSGPWSIGAYQPGRQAAAPVATLQATNVPVTAYGQTAYTFTITYTSAAGIEPSSVEAAIVTVRPPGGIGNPIGATVTGMVANGPADPWGDATAFTVTYKITPPHGSWTSSDNGAYGVEARWLAGHRQRGRYGNDGANRRVWGPDR